MLYLIGGPPRVGKSSLAQRLLTDLTIPYVSTDALTVMLKPMGEPSFYSPEKAARFFPMMDGFISRMLKICPDYTIEGDAFSPHHVDALKEKYELRAVYLGMSNISTENIIRHANYDNWAEQDNEEELKQLATRIVSASKEIEAECAHLGIPYFDLATDYDKMAQQAFDALAN